MNITDIYVATDLSEASASAARWAQNVKGTLGANVTVAHVVEVSVSNWFTSAMDTFEDHQHVEKAKENIRAWYKDATGADPDDVDIRMGSPAKQIGEIAGVNPKTAILVMSSTGKGALQRLFLGSTVARVAANPVCPLIVVHPEHESFEPNKSVVVGTDFSPMADYAVDASVGLAQMLHSPLHIVHANPAPPVLVFDGADVPVESLQASALSWSQSMMSTLTERLGTLPDGLTTEISVELPVTALVAAVKAKHAGLLVVGHSGESELMQHVLGSTAQRCLTEMPCTLAIMPRV